MRLRRGQPGRNGGRRRRGHDDDDDAPAAAEGGDSSRLLPRPITDPADDGCDLW